MGVQTGGQNGFIRRSAGMPAHLKITTVDKLVRYTFMCLGNTNRVLCTKNLLMYAMCWLLSAVKWRISCGLEYN